MKKLLLGIIAINLTFISANLALRSVEPVQAKVAGMDQDDLMYDDDFSYAVRNIVSNNCYVGEFSLRKNVVC
jgi:hypothetical protein